MSFYLCEVHINFNFMTILVDFILLIQAPEKTEVNGFEQTKP